MLFCINPTRQIIGFLDNNIEKQKTKELVCPFFAPEVVNQLDLRFVVIIGNRAGEMYEQLRELGVKKEKPIFLSSNCSALLTESHMKLKHRNTALVN